MFGVRIRKYIKVLIFLIACTTLGTIISWWRGTPLLQNEDVGTSIASQNLELEHFNTISLVNVSRFDGYVNDSDSHCKWITTVNLSGAVCAAYYDDRVNPIRVKVLGYWSRYLNTERFIYCDFTGDSGEQLWTVRASLAKMTYYVHEEFEYHPTFFHCNFDNKMPPDKAFPAKVRIRYANPNYSSLYQKLSSPWLEVQYMKRSAPTSKRNFTVCVEGPVFEDKPPIPVQLLVEFLEMNRILGAEFFTIYLNHPRPDLLTVLQDYASKGIVELVHWNVTTKLLFYFGQRAAVNDCLYRNMYKTKYLVFLDIDELIVPKLDHSWTSLMKRIDKTKKHGYFSFINVFFHNKHEPMKQFKEQYKLPCSAVTIPRYYENWKRTKASVWPHPLRTKYIAKPETANNAGVHFVEDIIPGFKVYKVKEEIGLMHHYRFPESWPKEETVSDTTMLGFATELLSALNKTMCSVTASNSSAIK